METKKLTEKTFGKGLLVGIAAIVTGIGSVGLANLGSHRERKYNGDCEIQSTGGVITDDDLRSKLRCDLRQVGYREESLNVIDEELLSLHEKEFGVKKGEVYITQVSSYIASNN
jgi:hypothetical protein